MSRIVFLVPGFLGFTNLGSLSYFRDVEQTLGRGLEERGIAARIVCCPTQPTGSITRRADRLRRQIIELGGLRARELHFIGHSTGGLDVRMLLTPGVQIAGGDTEERIARRTLSAISVATPHYGTPLANFFATAQGHRLLLLVSTLATSSPGRGALTAAARSLSLLTRLDDWLDRGEGPLDQAADALLRGLSFRRDDPVWGYLEAIANDQGAVLQLAPEVIDLFNASVTNRPGIDYACIVAGVARPRARVRPGTLLHPQRAGLAALFRLLYDLTSNVRPQYRYPRPSASVLRRLEQGLGLKLDQRVNDGLVPTLSQVHGRLLHATRGDHLDVVGHYTLAGPGAADWLPSGAGFTPQDFAATWAAVATAIARNSARR